MSSLLSERFALLGTVDPQSQDAATKTSDWCDMSKFSRVLALVAIGVVGGATTAKIEEATTSAGGSAQDLTGKTITALTATDDGSQAIINVHESELSAGFDFVRLSITNTVTGNLIFGAIFGGDASHEPASDNDLASVDSIKA